MKYAYIIIACFTLIACKKEESQEQGQNNDPIPPPSLTIDLSCHFNGNVGGATVEFTQNVSGYDGIDNNSLNINPSPTLSEAVYAFSIESTSTLMSIEIAHGSVLWDYSVSNTPSLSQFNDFHSTETTPNFAANALNGFEVIFTDNSGAIWKSDPMSFNAQSVSFTNVTLESGDNGDFAKFNCNFTCYVYNDMGTDSLAIDNAVLQGWFKR